ncbi:hypothetical protein B0H63DRAFT_529864 [Podospora didyma]|uniref:Uncharacterized protein n=1 Tax=Podospora didyma TaxID=330526 RepID=A0AAE0JZE6_9PEZI|nr:hypothetical protein B0H63DRAFT_529864 [Podospora didyma]
MSILQEHATSSFHRPISLQRVYGGGDEEPEQPPIQNYIEIPSVRATPLNHFNERVALIRPAMPTLMLNGAGERRADRWLVNRSGHHQRSETIDQLREELDSNSLERRWMLLNSVVQSSHVFRGTQPF